MAEGEPCALPSDRKLEIQRNAREAGGEAQPFPVWAMHGKKEDASSQAGFFSASSMMCVTVLNGVLELTHLQERSMTCF